MSMATIPAPEVLNQTWGSKANLVGWLSTVNHKAIASRFIVTAFVFFVIAGVTALVMRVQLARANLSIISPDVFNQLFTMHGTTMMFLFAIPIIEGVGMYFVPLMIGARDMAFPRLNAFGYYVYLLAGVSLYLSPLFENAPDAGWFNYVPLSTSAYSPGMGIDFWTTSITFLEIAALVAAVEMIVTIFKLRAPGMSLNRMPIFVWAMLVTSFMIIFAMPTVMLASVFLALDRLINTHFFDVAAGGDPLLWQHLFWIFGHPEVYIIFVPGLGMIAAMVSTFAGRPNAAYTLVVISLVGIGFLSFGLWVHHMFTTGLPWLGMSFFAAASMMVALPTGIQIFSWIATLWGSRPRLDSPMLWLLGFFFIFIIGGITGVMVGSIPFDEQVHDTYFVVAHFHYVIIGGLVFPLFAAIYYWFPKVTGKLVSETAGKWSFWLTFIGFNVAFLPMHLSGFWGMPRRYYTYPELLGVSDLNLVSTLGSFLLAAGFGLTSLAMFQAMRHGPAAGPNPWGAGTLEWATPSPPPQYNFLTIPMVNSRYPLWGPDQRGPVEPDDADIGRLVLEPEGQNRVTAGTDMLDARLESKTVLATNSLWPLFTALSVGVIFVGAVFTLWAVPVGIVLTYICALRWLWPGKEEGWS
jgi:cytochrome c oxidase subunit 1